MKKIVLTLILAISASAQVVRGPLSATPSAVPQFADSSGKVIANSGVILDVNGRLLLLSISTNGMLNGWHIVSSNGLAMWSQDAGALTNLQAAQIIGAVALANNLNAGGTLPLTPSLAPSSNGTNFILDFSQSVIVLTMTNNVFWQSSVNWPDASHFKQTLVYVVPSASQFSMSFNTNWAAYALATNGVVISNLSGPYQLQFGVRGPAETSVDVTLVAPNH